MAFEEAVDSAKDGREADREIARCRKPRDPGLRRLQRNITLGGGWLPVVAFAFLFATSAWQWLCTGHVSFIFLLSIVLLLTTLFGVSRSWSTREWLLVPGGLLIREGRLLGSDCRLRLIDRREGALVVHRLRQQHWMVCAADAGSHFRTVVTPHEAILVLRAWLSPLPPPPLERLSDLA